MTQNHNIKKVVIVGGVAGGANAAARLRRLNESLEIIILERSGYVSFANCGLPYHIGGEIPERDSLLLHTPKSLHARLNLDVRTHSEVQSIDRTEKTVLVKELATGRDYTESYDALILAPGAAPVRPPIPGLSLPGILSLRTIEDMDAIIERLKSHPPEKILLVGGGFIGLEMVEQLQIRLGASKTSFTLIEKNPHILTPLDSEMVIPMEDHLRTHGITVITGDAVTEFRPHDGRIEARSISDRHLLADLVIFNIGVRPETTLASQAGLALGQRGGIKVDTQLRTSDPHIYAVGDCIETENLVTHEYGVTPLAGPANRQGRIVADVIAGLPSSYKGCYGTAIVRVFELTAALTGANERTLTRLNIPYKAIYLHPNAHAGYYPGAHPIHLKVLYSPETKKILGAQAVGKDGVDKRIDVLATAIHAGLPVDELIDLELSYAPPFGSAKDPVNLAGMIAQNTANGLVETVTPAQLGSEPQDSVFLDVRSSQERERGTIPNSLHIPLPELRRRISELPKDKPLIVFCQSGLRSYNACRLLLQSGFRCKNLTGAFATWQQWQRS
jgi:NADPH-dependent 2,4-dienoyl-CoA reductase/sulfur reductase-like enzyme/rhodanese-related sulfurtransferase